MKKVLVFILAFLYIGSSAGATVHLHYCMGKLINTKLGHHPSKKCGQCGMEKGHGKDNGCCKDEHKQLKVEQDHKAAGSYQPVQLPAITLPENIFQATADNLLSVVTEYPVIHGPPLSGDIPVYLRYCVFLI